MEYTSAAKNMPHIFDGALAFKGDVSLRNVLSVTDMSFMFNDANESNQNISKWVVSSVTDISFMFYGAFKFNCTFSHKYVIND
jgi:Mycoplasma protein of unknown function, DUF285